MRFLRTERARLLPRDGKTQQMAAATGRQFCLTKFITFVQTRCTNYSYAFWLCRCSGAVSCAPSH